jgi:hypothetical protein
VDPNTEARIEHCIQVSLPELHSYRQNRQAVAQRQNTSILAALNAAQGESFVKPKALARERGGKLLLLSRRPSDQAAPETRRR